MCECVCASISETWSGSRGLRTHELGLIFCLITQWQARGCPVCSHAIGPLGWARRPRLQYWRVMLAGTKRDSPYQRYWAYIPKGRTGFYYTDVLFFTQHVVFARAVIYSTVSGVPVYDPDSVVKAGSLCAADNNLQIHKKTTVNTCFWPRVVSLCCVSIPQYANMLTTRHCYPLVCIRTSKAAESDQSWLIMSHFPKEDSYCTMFFFKIEGVTKSSDATLGKAYAVQLHYPSFG